MGASGNVWQRPLVGFGSGMAKEREQDPQANGAPLGQDEGLADQRVGHHGRIELRKVEFQEAISTGTAVFRHWAR